MPCIRSCSSHRLIRLCHTFCDMRKCERSGAPSARRTSSSPPIWQTDFPGACFMSVFQNCSPKVFWKLRQAFKIYDIWSLPKTTPLRRVI